MVVNFQDLFSGHASDYKEFRPLYPESLFRYLAALCPEKQFAWDCATGNGQAAVALKAFFDRVLATDASGQQLAQAEQLAGVEYRLSPAEQTQIASESVDLVSVAQALHWFDLPRFFGEVQRVLKPSGIIACWCYSLMTINPEIDALVLRLYDQLLAGYWSPERVLVDQHYASIRFPFEELQPPAFQMLQRWTLGQVIGYLNTWSAVRTYEQDQGINPIALIAEPLQRAWGDSSVPKKIVWPLHLRVGRRVESP